ncbi:MAG: RluA family pseudouridine synthase [Candidatus Omnitrophica bacterium]|nr:RluA family pseudouridine synthase [Candidatus Omnitrophota bacterium]
MQEYILKVDPAQNGMRLDMFLADFFQKQKTGLSRTSIQSMIRGGQVVLADEAVPKPHSKVKSGEEFKVVIKDKMADKALDAESIPLEVVYEDDDLAVINKQAGLVVHPAPGNREHTLVNGLLYRFGKLSDVNPERPGIVHRLDKETSGLLVVAKNNFTHLALAKQFADHSIKRTYIALVKGKVEFDEDVVEVPIARHPVKRESMAVSFHKEARFAKTRYRTIKRTDKFSYLELEPFTGRTHQLRVHCAFLGHPILGDTKYGKQNPFKRLALHAKSLGFIHPRTGKLMEFTSIAPEEFSEVIKNYP